MSVTCNQVYAEWPQGHWNWVDNGGPSNCNSNSDLLDFGSCYPGNFQFRTRSNNGSFNYFSWSTNIGC